MDVKPNAIASMKLIATYMMAGVRMINVLNDTVVETAAHSVVETASQQVNKPTSILHKPFCRSDNLFYMYWIYIFGVQSFIPVE